MLNALLTVRRALPAAPPGVLRDGVRLLRPLGRVPAVRRVVSALLIDTLAGAAPPRPRPLTLAADYACWPSLTDRTWSGRHLPPAAPDELPAEPDVVELFRRDGEATPSSGTSTMFMFFAQWFTDSFLRTSRSDPRRNTSNHEIDLCQIYGLHAEQARLLRSGEGGRLKSQRLDGQEFPPLLFEPRQPGARPVVKPEFAGLHDEAFLVDVILAGAAPAHVDTFFAVGLEHGNSTIGSVVLDTVFLREHNRVAGVLAAEHPDWDDDRLFETTRNILVVILLDLVVQEYIRHITPYHFPLENVRGLAEGAPWNRSNWCAIEFNLLYRWHSLAPDVIGTGADRLGPRQFRDNNPLVLQRGIESLVTAFSRQRAGRVGLRNTPDYLVARSQPTWPSVEERTVALMRTARLRSYNDYREHFGLKRLQSFEELTDDVDVRKRLDALYGDIDRLEWYVGIFAESYPDTAMMGDLLTTMVGCDAFTQALTNPLLAKQVYRADTFTQTGLDIIAGTRSLQQLVERNVADPAAVHVSFSC